MPIISKETWESIPQEEKDKIRQDYVKLIDEKRKISFTNDEISGAKYQMELLFGKENLQPQPLTYEDVARELFEYDGIDDKSHFATVPCLGMKWDNKLQAIGRLMVVAKFLNKDWKPNWENLNEEKWYFYFDKDGNFKTTFDRCCCNRIAYFRNKELTIQSYRILGEDTVRVALGDY